MAAITLLDGGVGQELVHRAGSRPTPLWSAQVMLEHPGLVEQVHRDFFKAGATIATTNTYVLHRDRLARAGVEHEFEWLHDAARSEAQHAQRVAPESRIAGSIGPLAGSYRPEAHPPHDEAVAKYAEVAKILESEVDFLLCESVASLAQLAAVMEGANVTGRPVWIALTVADQDGSLLRSKEAVADALDMATSGGAAAILANCSVPEAMEATLAIFATGVLAFGAYANGFTEINKDFLTDTATVEALSPRRDLEPESYAKFAMHWVDQGATIVGGCCEVGPSHIKEIADKLTARGHEIV